jgi:hypothetical protein
VSVVVLLTHKTKPAISFSLGKNFLGRFSIPVRDLTKRTCKGSFWYELLLCEFSSYSL